MREVRHHSQRPAGGDHLLEQSQQAVRVPVGHESLWPVRDRLRADPDRVHSVHCEDRLDM
jgi:hypothetical protein